MAQIIDGKAIAQTVKDSVKSRIEQRINKGHRKPGLAVVLVGSDPASKVYVNNKKKACAAVGIKSTSLDLPASTTQQELLQIVDDLNNDDSIDGILVQLPLPASMDAETIIERILPGKDIDGFHPYNIGRLAVRLPTFRSCTPFGVMKILEATGVEIKGKHAVVVGASNNVGRPMGLELLLAGCTVTTCHRFTVDLAGHVKQADIVIVGVGKANLIKGEWIKKGSIVIDIGMNRLESGKLTGDVEFEAAKQHAAWITPVPGGVGQMTVAMLMENTLRANEKLHP